MDRSACSACCAALTVALLFLLGCSAAPSAPPAAPAVASGTSTPASVILANAEPLVVFGSGRSLPASAHRRILDALHGAGPLTVRLQTGEERTYSCGADYMEAAAADGGAELRGAHFIVPAESFPCEVVADVMEIDFAQRTYMVLPGGETVPYIRCLDQREAGVVTHHPEHGPVPLLQHGQQAVSVTSYPGSNPYQHQPLFHKQPAVYDWLTPFAEDVPEDQLQVALGGTQRLSMKVHAAILDSYKAETPVEVDLPSGRHVTVATYEELLAKQVDPRFMGAQVSLAGGSVRVPIETYRAVVDAHKHKGVYVVDPDDHRVLYSEYVERRKASTKDKTGGKKGDKKRDKQKHE